MAAAAAAAIGTSTTTATNTAVLDLTSHELPTYGFSVTRIQTSALTLLG